MLWIDKGGKLITSTFNILLLHRYIDVISDNDMREIKCSTTR